MLAESRLSNSQSSECRAERPTIDDSREISKLANVHVLLANGDAQFNDKNSMVGMFCEMSAIRASGCSLPMNQTMH